jgi:release factor glutamine methyltransferase
MNSPLPDIAVARGSARPENPTLGAVFRELARAFRSAGLATPELDARLLVSAVCGLSHEAFAAAPERLVRRGEAEQIALFEARRLAGEPVSRILGWREFWGLRFAVTSQVLDPRPDTETLVAAVLELARGRPASKGPVSLLDIGTGSGCVLLSVLHELPEATGVGSDRDPTAVHVARANAGRLGLAPRARFFCGSWLEAAGGPFDFVVSNPPYIPSGEIDRLAAEVARFDPKRALDGGGDGLDAYRQIAPRLASTLKPGGWAVFEVGAGQADAVRDLLSRHVPGRRGAETRCWRDLAGIERCVAARAPK